MSELLLDFLGELTAFNDWFGVLFFWSPMFLNFIGYTLESWSHIQRDKKAVSENNKYYSDFYKVGDVFWYLFLTITPIVNCFAFFFDCLPDLFNRIYKRLGWLFDIQFIKDDRNNDNTH